MENNDGLRRASTLPLRALYRPVVARIVEPVAWCGALALWTSRSAPSTMWPIAAALAVALLARLIADTAPNLVASPRLEDAPYDEPPIRQALTRTKLLLAVSLALLWHVLACLSTPGDPVVVISTAAGGPIPMTLGLLLFLASFTAAPPILREHRGVPIARPSLAPSTGALMVLMTAAWTGPAPGHILSAATVAVVAANVIVGGAQRYQAAARRIRNPARNFAVGNLPQGSLDRADEDRVLLSGAIRAAGFVITPVWVPVQTLFAGTSTPVAAGLAALLAAAPALVFDAKRPSVRFDALSMAAVIALLSAHFATSAEPYLRTAAIACAWPPASRILARGRAGALGLCCALLITTTALTTRLSPDLPAPAAEILFAVCVFIAASRCDRPRPR